MTDYGTMQSAIADELANDGDLSTAQIKTAIQRAIKHYERRPFWFNQKVATLTTIAGQEYYGASDLADIPNIVQIDAATSTLDGVKTKLHPYDFGQMDAAQDGITEAFPTAYSVYASQIRLWPIPDAAYTVTLSYIYRFTELSLDADTNAWMTFGEELIRQSAKRRCASDYLHADDIATRAAAFEFEAYDALLAETRRRLPKAPLRTEAVLGVSSYNIVSDA